MLSIALGVAGPNDSERTNIVFYGVAGPQEIPYSATIVRTVIAYLLLGFFGGSILGLSIIYGFGLYMLKLSLFTAIVSSLIIVAKRLNQKGKDKSGYSWAKFGQDIGFVFKMIMTALTLLQGVDGLFIISAIFLYEKTHLFPEKSVIGKMARKYPVGSVILQLVLYATLISAFNFVTGVLTKVLATMLLSGQNTAMLPVLFDIVSLLGLWLPLLGMVIMVAKMHGASFEKLWFLNGRKKGEAYISWKRDKFKILIFMLTALSAFAAPLIFSASSIVATISLQTLYLLLSTVMMYAVQPLVEELFFRSGLIHYFKSEGVVDSDTTKTNIWSKLSVSALGGILFAVVHQMVRGFTTLLPYLRLFACGFSLTLITLTTGNIAAATLYHSLHNFCCTMFRSTFCSAGQLSIGPVDVNPVVAETARTVLTIKDHERSVNSEVGTSVAVAG